MNSTGSGPLGHQEYSQNLERVSPRLPGYGLLLWPDCSFLNLYISKALLRKKKICFFLYKATEKSTIDNRGQKKQFLFFSLFNSFFNFFQFLLSVFFFMWDLRSWGYYLYLHIVLTVILYVTHPFTCLLWCYLQFYTQNVNISKIIMEIFPFWFWDGRFM